MDVAILALAFALRVYRLGVVGLDFDEAFSVQAGFKDVAGILTLLTTVEPHPPFYYSFIHLWYPLAGTSGFALRFPSLAANVITIAFLIRLATWLGWRSAGRTGAVLLAFNPFQVWYAQEARMYAPVALFGLAALFYGLVYARDGGRRSLVLAAIFMLLALATHYYAIFLFLFANASIVGGLILARRTARLRGWLVAQFIVGVALLAWLAYASGVSLGYTRTLPGPLSLFSTVKDSLVFYSVGTSVPYDLGTRLALVFLGVIAVGFASLGLAARSEPAGRWRAVFLGGYLFVPVVGGFLVSLVRELYEPRYLMVSAPAFFLALGLGVLGLYRRARPLGVGIGVFLIGAEIFSLHNAWTDSRYDKAELADAITYIQQHVSPGDGIILDGFGQSTTFWYYNDVLAARPTPSYQLTPPGPGGWAGIPANLDAIMARQRGVWLLDYGVQIDDPERVVETYLARNYFQAYYHVVLKNRVVYYRAPPSTAPTITPLDDACNGQVVLKDFESYGASVTAGEILPVALRWQAIGPARPNYVVSWRLADAAGHVVQQHDVEPSAGFSPSSTWTDGEEVVDREGLLIPSSLPPGAYSLAIVVYEKSSRMPCAFTGGSPPVAETSLPLERIEVSDGMPITTYDVPAPIFPARTMAGGLTFLGSDLEPGPYRPGDTATVRLTWRVDRHVTSDDVIDARLLTAGGEVILDQASPLGPDGFPTSRWQPGRLVTTYVDLPVPAMASTGTYRLGLTVLGDGSARSELQDLPTVRVVARPHTYVLPAMAHAVDADFDNVIQLRGYDLTLPGGSVATPGQPIHLTLYWQDEQEMDRSFTVFAHLVGADGKIYAQDDAVPLTGRAPTDGWVSGEVLTDSYDLVVSPNAPAGRYRLEVGWYDPTTGQRLPLIGRDGDSLLLTGVVAGQGT